MGNIGSILAEAANVPTTADWLAAWGQVVGAFATFAAVVVALWLASRESGRVKVVLKMGGLADDGLAKITAPLNKVKPGMGADLTTQGFTRPIVEVEVANIGRLPVTIKQWGFYSRSGLSLSFPAAIVGPAPPYRLDVGDSIAWAVDAVEVHWFVQAVKAIKNARQGDAVVAEVGLADGRIFRSTEAIR